MSLFSRIRSAMSTRQILNVAVVLLAPLFLSACVQQEPPPTKIVWWNVFDDPRSFNDIIKTYEENVNVEIELVTFPFATYEDELIDALAAGRGPDIFTIHNSWLPEHSDKIQPVPATEDFAHLTDKEFEPIAPRLEELIDLRTLTDDYVDVVSEDFVKDGRIFALPLYVDSLALFYNEDLLASSGFPRPPTNWTDFAEAAGKLTEVDAQNRVTRAGAAMGASQNINRSTDILTALMIQNGAVPVDGQLQFATFDRTVKRADGSDYNPGVEALEYYTSFSNQLSDNFSWSLDQDVWYSIDNFAAGQVAMMLNYSHQVDRVRAANPNLNFSVARFPQVEGAPFDVTYANYWGQTVSRSSDVSLEAWEFINYLARDDNNLLYLEQNHKPPAKTTLIKAFENDLDLGVFADQAAVAKSFYSPDMNLTETVFSQAIDAVVTGQSDAETALRVAASQITQRLQSREFPDIGI